MLAIHGICSELLSSQILSNGNRRKLDWSDILIVAPFNLQVRALSRALGNRARVGTVDRFQGQEAPVVIVSLCHSSLGDEESTDDTKLSGGVHPHSNYHPTRSTPKPDLNTIYEYMQPLLSLHIEPVPLIA